MSITNNGHDLPPWPAETPSLARTVIQTLPCPSCPWKRGLDELRPWATMDELRPWATRLPASPSAQSVLLPSILGVSSLGSPQYLAAWASWMFLHSPAQVLILCPSSHLREALATRMTHPWGEGCPKPPLGRHTHSATEECSGLTRNLLFTWGN